MPESWPSPGVRNALIDLVARCTQMLEIKREFDPSATLTLNNNQLVKMDDAAETRDRIAVIDDVRIQAAEDYRYSQTGGRPSPATSPASPKTDKRCHLRDALQTILLKMTALC